MASEHKPDEKEGAPKPLGVVRGRTFQVAGCLSKIDQGCGQRSEVSAKRRRRIGGQDAARRMLPSFRTVR